MRTFVLSLSYLKVLIMGLLMAATIHYFFGGIGANGAKIEKLKVDIQASSDKLKRTTERTADKAKFQEEVERMSQIFRLALDYLPKELDIQDLLRKIYSESRAAGVQLTNFKPKDPVSKDFYDELLMEIELRGTYPQLVLFLSYVSKLPRIINIKNVELGEPVYLDGVATLRMKGTLVAYRYKEGK